MDQLWVGMSGVGRWGTEADGHRPKNWDSKYYELFPQGRAKLNAILSAMSSTPTDDIEFKWWEDVVQAQGSTITGIYTGNGLTAGVALANGTSVAAGTVLFIAFSATAADAEAAAKRFRPNLEVMLRDQSDISLSWVAEVVDVVIQGAKSHIAVKTLNAHTYATSTVDYVQVIGDINVEGGYPVESRFREQTLVSNYCQTWKEAWEITEHAKRTNFRTGKKPEQLKAQALARFNEQREFGYLFGRKSLTTSAENGGIKATTQGILPFILDNCSENVANFSTSSNTKYDGKTWLTAGKQFLDDYLEQLFAWTTGSVGAKLALCGSGAVSGLNRLASTSASQFQMSERSTTFGWSVWKYRSPFGDIDFLTYPPFTLYPGFSNTMLLLEPQNLKRRVMQATEHRDVTPVGMHGEKYEFVAIDGLQLLFPKTFMVLDGIGVDNAA